VPGGWSEDDDQEADERTLVAAANGRAQALYMQSLVRRTLRSATIAFRTITPELVCEMNRLAMVGLMPTAGKPRRRSDIEIAGSRHVLPDHDEVPFLIKEACNFVNLEAQGDALFLAAYILWRICWIHPFEDGNGRVAATKRCHHALRPLSRRGPKRFVELDFHPNDGAWLCGGKSSAAAAAAYAIAART